MRPGEGTRGFFRSRCAAARPGSDPAYPWRVPLLPADAPARACRLTGRPDVAVTLVEAGLACCGLEVGSALTRGLLEEVPADAEPPAVHVLAISGTVTQALAPALERAWAGLGEPRAAIAFGACATAGGPYWDGPQVLPGAHGVIPVSVVVAGCPPRPQALIEGIVLAAAQATGHAGAAS